MRTPIRKPGKYTHDIPDPNMTIEKFNELEEKLSRAKKRRPALIEEVKRLALMGDFSENAAYQLAKGRLRGLNHWIHETKKLLSRVDIINDKKKFEIVELGATVKIKILEEIISYKILGSSETDPNNNIISNNSPFGSSLMGKRVGDSVILKKSGNEIEGSILEID